MKRIYSLIVPAALLLAVTSCKKDDSTSGPAPVATSGKVQVGFSNMIGSERLTTGTGRYTNASGNRYSVDMLKYYVSHFSLIRDDSTEIVTSGHELIDQADSASRYFTLDSIPNGRYIAARFYLGVDRDHNHSGAQDGDLDPIHGMIWSWSTGYMFMKLEGSYYDSSNTPQALFYHFGTDIALSRVTVPLQAMEIKGNTRRLNLRFDLNALFAGPPMIDFDVDNNRMSTSADDFSWIGKMRGNMLKAFSVSSID